MVGGLNTVSRATESTAYHQLGLASRLELRHDLEMPDRAVDDLLRSTPYVIGDEVEATQKFRKVLANSAELAARASSVGERIAREAADIFDSFGVTLRSEVVAESNQMEHLHWTSAEVREIVVSNRDLLSRDAHAFMEGIRGDERAYEALGLYKAQLIADDWAKQQIRPREHEIRELHALITMGEWHAGKYKVGFNEIAGADHIPPAPADAAEGMRQLARWLETGTGDPSFDATIVHAWLAHLHPFEDGNGRMARLLANLALAQGGYPPLILSASSDRGQYYDALAASDLGDILPLYDLFGRVLRRTTKIMSSPDYVANVIQDRVLVSESQHRGLWEKLAHQFSQTLRARLRSANWSTHAQGYPSAASFHFFRDRVSDGNSWYLKVLDAEDKPRWLLWFGYNSDEYLEVFDGPSTYPSVFFSIRSDSSESIHPYEPFKGIGDGGDVSELVLSPGRPRPARLQEGYRWSEYSIVDAAERVARSLLRRS